MFLKLSKKRLEKFEDKSIDRERRKHKSQNFWGAIHINPEGIVLGSEEQNRILNDLKKTYQKD